MESNGVYNKFNYRNVVKYEGQRKNGLMESTGTYYHWGTAIGGNFIMEDKTMVCINCGKEFTFTEGEQEFYK